jgi:hypothetical protein
MAGIDRFEAIPVESGLRFSWDLSSALVTKANCKSIYLYINSSLTDGVVREVKVIPLVDPSTNNLTNEFLIDNLINGQKYLTQLEVTVLNGSTRSIYNSSVEGIPSTVPPKPFLYLQTQSKDSGFDIQISKTKGFVTKLVKNSLDDGHSELTGVYVVFTNGTTMQTTFIDASGIDLYNNTLHVAAPFGNYEVAISIENKNGRSDLSESVEAIVDTSVTGVRVTRVVELMAIDPSASFNKLDYNAPEILLTWNAPSNLGTPILEHYIIKRATIDSSGNPGTFTQVTGGRVAVVDALTSANANSIVSANITDSSYAFVDKTVTEGVRYRYNIQGENDNGLGKDAIFINTTNLVRSRDIRAVAWPIITNVKTSPGDRTSEIDTTVSGGFDLSANHQFSVKYTGSLPGSLGTDTDTLTGTNPVTLRNLTNNVVYALEVTAQMLSPNQSNTTYTTDKDTSKNTTPISTIPAVTNFSANPLDNSGNPLDGKVRLLWRNPAVGTFTGLRYIVERKLSTSPDASYSVDASDNVSANANVEIESLLLDNGKMYDFRIFTSYFNDETKTNYESSKSAQLNIMPFASPAAPTSVRVDYINSTTDLSFQYVDVSVNTWGPNIVGHRYTLYNLNNGLQVPEINNRDIDDGSYNTLRRGRLATLLQTQLSAGTRYALNVDSYVVVNGVKHYSVAPAVSSLVSTWTKPTGIKSTASSNTELISDEVVPLSTSSSNGIVKLSWNTPVGQDASSISYRVFRNIGDQLLNSSPKLTNTSFNIEGLPIGGSPVIYYVLALMNSDASGASPITSDKSTADTVGGFAIFRPAAVTGGIHVRNVNSTSLDFSFNGVTSHGGMSSALTKYFVELLDISGSVVVNSQEINHSAQVSGSFTGLSSGITYKVRVTTRATNTLNGASEVIESATSSVSGDIAPYDQPINVTEFEIKPADEAIVVKWVPIGTNPEGLVYTTYRVSHKRTIDPDASYTSVDISPKSLSSYIISSLTNGTQYSVKINTVYNDRLGDPKSSNDSVVLRSTPDVGPATPGLITTTVLSTGTGITISWPIPGVNDNTTHYSLTVDGSNVNYHFQLDNVSIDEFDLVGNRLEFTLSNVLESGKTYVIKLYAELQREENGIIFYSSSNSSNATVTTFRNPGVPRNVSATLGDRTIFASWEAPLDTAGKEDALEYEIYLSDRTDLSGNYLEVRGIKMSDKNGVGLERVVGTDRFIVRNLILSPINRIPIKIENDACSNIVNRTEYIVLVRSRFEVSNDGTPSTQTSLYARRDKLYPRIPPTRPTVSLNLIQQVNAKSFIEVTMNSDASFNVTKYELYRQIFDASTNLASTSVTKIYEKDFASDLNGNTSESNRIDIFNDNNTGLAASTQWLDGNRFDYYVTVYYNDNNINPLSGTNGDEVLTSTTQNLVKTSPPFPCDAQGRPTVAKVGIMDASNNTFTYLINKAGSSIHTVNAVVLDASNISVISSEAPSGVDTYSVTAVPNARINSVTAANQIVRVTIRATPGKAINDVLAVNANSVGSCIAIWPQDGTFANLRN